MRAVVLCVLMSCAGQIGCNGEEPCVEVDLTCAPLYQPTFQNVFDQTLRDTCGVDGPCHNSESARAGLIFEDIDEAYQLLMENDRVIPFDPDCSLVVKRIESSKSSFVMPPGSDPLDVRERCAIEQWIANGAER